MSVPTSQPESPILTASSSRHQTDPLFTSLTDSISSARVELVRLETLYRHLLSSLEPERRRLAEEDHHNAIVEKRSQVEKQAHEYEREKTQWHQEDEPRIRQQISQLESEHQEFVRQIEELLTTTQTVQEEVKRLHMEDERFKQRTESIHVGIGSLPIKCLQHILTFLTRSDLHRAICSSFAFQRLWDRGALWSVLTIQLVRDIVRRQELSYELIESRRRMLGGLNQDFHTSNFLAACARPLEDMIKSLSSTTSTLKLTPQQQELPRDTSCTTSVTVATKSDQPLPPVKRGSISGPVTLPKADLFTRALTALQQQVDPALSDFEDLSQRLGSHQSIITFLQIQTQQLKHKLGMARISVGSELDQLRALSEAKDQLAKEIQEIERNVTREKKIQSDLVRSMEDELRQLRAEKNIRSNANQLMLASPSAPSSESSVDDSFNPSVSPPEPNSGSSSAEGLTEAIATLKHQKKILVKAVKSMHAEHEAIERERFEYQQKIEQMKQQIGR